MWPAQLSYKCRITGRHTEHDAKRVETIENPLSEFGLRRENATAKYSKYSPVVPLSSLPEQ